MLSVIFAVSLCRAWYLLNVMLSAIMLSTLMLSVIRHSVVAPQQPRPLSLFLLRTCQINIFTLCSKNKNERDSFWTKSSNILLYYGDIYIEDSDRRAREGTVGSAVPGLGSPHLWNARLRKRRKDNLAERERE
jgi:hypothetical protein